MVENAPPTVDLQEFQFKLHSKCKIFDNTNDSNFKQYYNLVAAASRFGILAVGSDKSCIEVIQLSAIQQIEPVNVKTATVCPKRRIDLPSNPTHLSLNCDQTILAVVCNKNGCAIALLFRVATFLSQTVEIIRELRLSATPGVGVLETCWNPAIPNVFTACKSDGSLGAYTILDSSIDINEIPAMAAVRCFCWSPKGKQLVVGAVNGSLTQYKPDMKAVKVIQPPPLQGQGPFSVVNLFWLTNYQFIALYKDMADQNGRPTMLVVNAPKTGNISFINYEDICYSYGNLRAPQYYMIHQPNWGVLLVASANSMELGVLGIAQAGEPAIWQQWTQIDSARAELPLAQNHQETFPIGLAFDTGITMQLPWGDNQTLPPMPMIHILSHYGLLCSFSVINLRQGSNTICGPPEHISDQSGISKFIIETVAPPVAPVVKPTPPQAPPASVAPPQFGQPLNLSAQQPTNLAQPQPPIQTPLIKPSPQAPSIFSSPMGVIGPGGSIFSGSLPNSSVPAIQTSQPAQIPQAAQLPPPSLFSGGGNTGSGSLFGGTPNFSAAFGAATPRITAPAPTNFNFISPATSGSPFALSAPNNQIVSNSTASVATTPVSVPSAPSVNFSSVNTASSGGLFGTPTLPSYPNPPKPTFNLPVTTSVNSASPAPPSYNLPAKPITGTVVPTGISQPLLATPKEPPILTLKPQTSVAPLKQPDVTPIRSTLQETIQTPQVTTVNDQVSKISTKEDTSINNEMLQGLIKEEMKNFHSELQDLFRRCKNINLDVGTDDEKSNLVLTTESLLEFYKELQEATNSQVSEVYLLKQALMQSFAWFEDAKARHRRYNDPNFSSMLLSQKLDPVSEKQLGDIQHLTYYIEAQLKQVDGFLDNQWSDFQDSCKKQIKGKMHMPTLEPIYQALVKQNAILQRHKYVVKDIDARIKSRNKKASTLPHVMNKLNLNHVGGIRIEDEIQKLKLDSDDVFSARYDRVSATEKKFTEAKQSKLCIFFTNRNVIHISPKKPKFVNNVLQNTSSKINFETSPRVQRSLRSTFDQIAHDTSLNTSLNTSMEANLSASNIFSFTLDKNGKTPEKTGHKTAASLLFDTPKAKPDNGISIPKPQSTSSMGTVFNFSAAVSPTKQQQTFTNTPPAVNFNPPKSTAMNLQPQFQPRTFESGPVSSQSTTLIKPNVIKSTAVDSSTLFSSGDAKPNQSFNFVPPQAKQPATSKPMFQISESTTAAHPRESLDPGFGFGATLSLGQQSTPKPKSTEAGGLNFGQMLSQMSTAVNTPISISTAKAIAPLSGITITSVSSVSTPGATPKPAFSFILPTTSSQPNIPSLIPNSSMSAMLPKSDVPVNTPSIFSGVSKPHLNSPAPVQNIFSSASNIPSSGGSLFGAPKIAPDSGGSIFATGDASTPIFGTAKSVATPETPGAPTSLLTGSSFGAKSSTPSLPGGASTGNIFGAAKSVVDTPSTVPNQSGSIFADTKLVSKADTPEVDGTISTTTSSFSFFQPSATIASTKPSATVTSAFGGATQGSLFESSALTQRTVSVVETSTAPSTTPSSVASSFGFAQPSLTTTTTVSSFAFAQTLTATTPTSTSSFGMAAAPTVTTSSLSFGQPLVSPVSTSPTAVSLAANTTHTHSFVQPVATEPAKSTTLFGGTTTSAAGFASPQVPPAFGSSNNGSSFSFGNLTVSALSPNSASASPPVISTATTVAPAASAFSFASPTGTAPSNTLFGQPTATTTAASSFSFASPTGSAPNNTLFGQPTASTTAASSFMGLSICSPSTFSNPTQSQGQTTGSLFGQASTTNSTNIFAQKSDSASAATNIFAQGTKGIFGQTTTPATTSTTSLFGQTQSSPFGAPATASTASAAGGSIFGQSAFGTPTTTATSSIFGQPSNFGSPVATSSGTTGSFSFTNQNTATSGFGSSPGNVFGAKPAFGTAPAFGQPPTFGSSANFGAPAATGGSIFGSSSPASQSTGGSFGSPASFGSPSAFGQKPAFGSPSAFGQQPQPQSGFGSPPAFGNSPSFGSPQRVFGGSPAPVPSAFGATQENSTFANLANQTTLGFGSLAQNQAAPPPQQPQFSGGSQFSSWR